MSFIIEKVDKLKDVAGPLTFCDLEAGELFVWESLGHCVAQVNKTGGYHYLRTGKAISTAPEVANDLVYRVRAKLTYEVLDD